MSLVPPSSLADRLRAHLQARTGLPVVLHETHISWVLLTADRAWKLKKPVKLPFLDFSTAPRRQHFCEEELRINRRFAPALYLRVVPVRGTQDAPHLGGRGAAIDHAVCMRRFADNALLSRRLQAGKVNTADVDTLARRIAMLHLQAPALPPQARFTSGTRTVRAIHGVLDQVAQRFGDAAVADVQPWLASQWQALAPLWQRRRAQGAIRECHGDLHAQNIAWIDDAWCPFDAIEFDPALRWIDVMADLAFLTMDLRARGRPAFAHRLLDTYLEATGDFDGLKLLRCYEVYRALVRALALGLQPPHVHAAPPSAHDYLACARALVREAARPPRLLITCGVSGSGKSTAAQAWVERDGAVRVRSDVERKRLFGLQPLQRSAEQGLRLYDSRITARTYRRLSACARAVLAAGRSAVVDATFLRQAQRKSFQGLAEQLGVPFAILHCSTPEAVLRERVAARQHGRRDASEADLQVLEQQLRAWEPLTPDEQAHTLTRRRAAGAAACDR